MKPELPRHVGIIPDGNRRWAAARGLPKGAGYGYGLEPGLRLFERCRALGVEQLSVYGFTQDNVKRPVEQVCAFREACARMALALDAAGADVRVVGDASSPAFPDDLRGFLAPKPGRTGPRVNLLCNYGWRWDLEGLAGGRHRTSELPAMELVVRWGGGRRLSGFLPVQSVYADLFVVDALWPDFAETHVDEALAWYARQDRTLGG